jgi:dipeptidyl-peptidase-4
MHLDPSQLRAPGRAAGLFAVSLAVAAVSDGRVATAAPGAAAPAQAAPAAADPPRQKLTLERIHADPPLAGHPPERFQWHPDGKRLTFLRRVGETQSLFAIDTGRGAESLLLDGTKLQAPGDTPRTLPLASAAWLADGRTLLVPAFGDAFTVDVRTGSVRALVQTKQSEEFFQASPDGRRVAFVRDNDLYCVDVASGRESRLTQGGSDTLLNGRLDWVYEEELASRSGQAFVWSPDSRKIAYLQLDQARVPTFPIVDFLPVRNEVEWQRYPKAGAPNSVVRVGVVGLLEDGRAGQERLVSFAPDDVYVLPQMSWTPDSRSVAFQHLNRAQDQLELRLLGVPDSPSEPLGSPRTLLREESKAWVNTFDAPRFLKDGRRFLWMSERSGYAHVYLCELTGACRAVTQGSWLVDGRTSFTGAGPGLVLDERSGFLYLTSTEKDPRERQLYRTRLDGTGRTQLTREPGTHRTVVSPDGRFFADVWSNVETPPRAVLSSQDGTRRYPLDDGKAPPLAAFERGRLEWVELEADDKTRLYGSLLVPEDFDPARRYPVVVSVYGGPHSQTVTNSWTHVSPRDSLLASRGFLVFKLDNRGMAGRGTAFEFPVHRNLGSVELRDQLAGVAWLKSRPFVDPERIGITGWSYGGYMTLYALTHAPEVFRSGVAGAPVSDWKHYDSIYTERYMGTPQANPAGYETSSPLAKAGSLAAELLLVHGSSDDNVHLANTLSFVAALIKAGKPYSLQLHPRQLHGFRGREDRIAADRALLAHFERTLRPDGAAPATPGTTAAAAAAPGPAGR